jgi:Zn-dependent protease with chaperone function
MGKILAAAEQIRSAQDSELFAKLLEDASVKAVNAGLERQQEQGPLGTRRRLLATAVRLSRAMAPNLYRMADHCGERLGLDIPLELYVFSSPQFNAACVKPEEGRLFVMFSSSILEGFSEAELQFVMGHELGHYIYGHHDIPIGHILRGGASQVSPRLALTLSSWSRYAEVSADRAGALCSDSLDTVARALFKLASGLTESVVTFDLAEFLKQVDEMQIESDDAGAGAPPEDWFATHPFSPIRVKALQLYYESELACPGGVRTPDLEVAVQGLMSLMEPSYIEGRTKASESMRRLLFTAAVVLMDVNGEISKPEIASFEQFFGANALSDRLDIEKTKATLDDRVAQANEQATLAQRMQVLRDLCCISRADGPVADSECKVLRSLAADLGIGEYFVRRTLEELNNVELD